MKNKKLQKQLLFLLVAAGIIAAGQWVPNFLTVRNIFNVLKQSSITAVASVGLTLVIISGGTDLSAGGLMTLAGVVNMILYRSGFSLGLSLICTLIIGAVLGLADGIFIAKIKIPPFISTLVFGNIASGFAMLISQGMSMGSIDNQFFKAIGNGQLFNTIPIPVLIMIIFTIAGSLLLQRTSLGNSVYGIGYNAKVVKQAGIDVDRVLIIIFCISGFCSTVAGIILSSWLNTAHPTLGTSYQLDTIAACVIGGTVMGMAEGKAWGSVSGAIIITVIRNILNLLGINPYIQNLCVGFIMIIIVAAVTFFRRDLAKKSSLF